jgi:hypothetical protein
METFNDLNLNSFEIRIKTLSNGSKDISIKYDDFDFVGSQLSNLSYTYNTRAKQYNNLKDGIVNQQILSATQKQAFLHSIKNKLYNLNKKKKTTNNMRQHIIESAVKNATNKKDKDLDVSEFDFSEVETKDFDDFNFGFEETLVPIAEQDKNKQLLDEIKEIESQIEIIDDRINTHLHYIVETKVAIKKAESAIFDLGNLMEHSQDMLDDEIKEKVNLRLTIEALKTNLQ